MSLVSTGEAQRRMTEYLSRFSDSVTTQDASSLKQLFSVSSHSHSQSLLSLADALNVFKDANKLIKQCDRYSQLGEILVPLLRCLQSYRIGNLVDAYNAFEKSAKMWLNGGILLEFQNWESAWAMEAMFVIAYEIRVLAEKADGELASLGKIPKKLKAAGSFLI